jgi:hypothetical protein
MDTVNPSTRFHEIPRGNLVESFPFHQIPRGFRGKNRGMSAPTTTTAWRYLDVKKVALVRWTAAHGEIVRPTPKPGLEVSAHGLCSLLCRFLSRFLPKLCGKDAAAVADLYRILPQTYRRCTERGPSADCMACCERSMSCSRAALHIAPCSLRQGQAARRASRWERSLPTRDVWKRRKTCPAQNQEFCATKAKHAKSEIVPAIRASRWLSDSSFSRATLARVIEGETGTQTR